MSYFQIKRLQALIRHHRQHCFDEPAHVGEAHSRAIARLKQTKTFRELAKANRDSQDERRSARLLQTFA
jgi:hypothetical protein